MHQEAGLNENLSVKGLNLTEAPDVTSRALNQEPVTSEEAGIAWGPKPTREQTPGVSLWVAPKAAMVIWTGDDIAGAPTEENPNPMKVDAFGIPAGGDGRAQGEGGRESRLRMSKSPPTWPSRRRRDE